jgi:polysaccharide deacetylase family protein (PEP-CTERM system associated)
MAASLDRTSSPRTSVLNAMSIDVEDYFQVSVFAETVPRSRWSSLESRVCANTDRLLAIFDSAGVHATFFILGWIAERHPDLVKRIGSLGHEIASHGHAHELVYKQTHHAFRDDVRRAKAVLEATAGIPVIGYRAPSFSITRQSLWALDILVEEGFEYDASIFPIHHDRYGIPESPRHPYVIKCDAGSIVEVPGSTARVGFVNVPVSGGGYFRIAPYAWTRWAIEYLNRRAGESVVFYVHPWEIDPEQPRLPANWFGRFRHYRNLDKTEARLESLLDAFRFGPVRSILREARLPVVNMTFERTSASTSVAVGPIPREGNSAP